MHSDAGQHDETPTGVVSDTSVVLSEWDTSDPLQLSADDLSFIEQQINAETKKIGTSHTSDGKTTLSSSRYVGIASLPDGPKIEVVPKSAGENFLWLFQYASGVDAQTVGRKTDVEGGPAFLDALGALYADELNGILQQGIAKAYRQKDGTEEYVRGRVNVQRQLQRQGFAATQFECSYDELTTDTPANQALLYAALVLEALVSDGSIRRSLDRYVTRLRRDISIRPVRPHEFDAIEVTRLNEYYKDALRLAELVIRNVFVEDLRHGTRGSYGLFINMDTIFESVVEQAFRGAVSRTEQWQDWRVERQANITGLVTGGSPSVTMRPDVVVRDAVDSVVFTGDAKWKTGTIRQSDIYQLTAYQLADNVPGALIYPSQDGNVKTEYTVRETYPMRIHEIPTSASVSSYEELKTKLEANAETLLNELLATQ